MTDLSDIFGTPIAIYTMSQALADGTLVDAGALAQQLYRIPRDVQFQAEPEPELVTLKAALATHDDGTPVIVIGFPEED